MNASFRIFPNANENKCWNTTQNRISLSSLQIMAGRIKLFRSVENTYKSIGIYTRQSNQFFAVNFRKVFFLLLMLLSTCSFFANFLLETSVESLYNFIADLLDVSYLFVTIWQMPNIVRLIETYEQFIERSKRTTSAVLC